VSGTRISVCSTVVLTNAQSRLHRRLVIDPEAECDHPARDVEEDRERLPCSRVCKLHTSWGMRNGSETDRLCFQQITVSAVPDRAEFRVGAAVQ
jgi:hypothetical protein